MDRSIGKKIRQMRDFLELKQEDFANLIGTNQGHLSNIENGKHEPGMDILYTIIQAFPNLNLYWFFGISPAPIFIGSPQTNQKNTSQAIQQKQEDFMNFIKKENEYLSKILHLTEKLEELTKKEMALI